MCPGFGKKTLSGFESRTSRPGHLDRRVVALRHRGHLRPSPIPPIIAPCALIRDHAGAAACRRARLSTLTYEADGRIARITLDRPERGNGITLEMPRELAACVERANLDPEVHVIALAGNGTGFCGGYDLVASAEGKMEGVGDDGAPEGSPLDPMVQAPQPRPERHLGPGHRLPDDEPQRPRLHEPLPLREAGDLQGPRLLRRRRHRHGALLGPARGRGQGQDRLPARARLGRADDGAVGLPDRPGPSQAAAADRRLDRRHHGGRVGPRHARPRPRRSSTMPSSRCSSGSPAFRSTSS